jgi:hypothetical protein
MMRLRQENMQLKHELEQKNASGTARTTRKKSIIANAKRSIE